MSRADVQWRCTEDAVLLSSAQLSFQEPEILDTALKSPEIGLMAQDQQMDWVPYSHSHTFSHPYPSLPDELEHPTRLYFIHFLFINLAMCLFLFFMIIYVCFFIRAEELQKKKEKKKNYVIFINDDSFHQFYQMATTIGLTSFQVFLKRHKIFLPLFFMNLTIVGHS